MSEQISILSEIEELLGDDLGQLRSRKSAEREEARQARVAELLSQLPEAQSEYDAAVERASKARESRGALEKKLSAAVTENGRARYARAQAGKKRDAIMRKLHDLQGGEK